MIRRGEPIRGSQALERFPATMDDLGEFTRFGRNVKTRVCVCVCVCLRAFGRSRKSGGGNEGFPRGSTAVTFYGLSAVNKPRWVKLTRVKHVRREGPRSRNDAFDSIPIIGLFVVLAPFVASTHGRFCVTVHSHCPHRAAPHRPAHWCSPHCIFHPAMKTSLRGLSQLFHDQTQRSDPGPFLSVMDTDLPSPPVRVH